MSKQDITDRIKAGETGAPLEREMLQALGYLPFIQNNLTHGWYLPTDPTHVVKVGSLLLSMQALEAIDKAGKVTSEKDATTACLKLLG